MIQDANGGQNHAQGNSDLKNSETEATHEQKATGQKTTEHQQDDNVETAQTSDAHSANAQMNQSTIDETVHNESEAEAQKIKIEFPYSELARAAVPKAFDVAETVATQWVNDQKFENLGLPNHIAEFAADKALEKAKEVEKKLEEKGVITAAKMGIEIAKLQAQSLLQKWKK